MHLAPIDWAIMIAYLAISLMVGVAVSRRAGKDFSSFFLGGRNLTWPVLGVSMVATTFSTDTPNLVADIVRSKGVFGNWVWWPFLITGMLTVFLYAKLWRRSGVLTDIEFYELRYSGKAAAFLRGFRAVYLGLVFNLMIMAAVTLAAIKIGGILTGFTPLQTVVVIAAITMIYSALGGLEGVVLTDFFLFLMAMTGSIWAAWYIVTMPEVGGLQPMLAHENVAPLLDIWPDFEAMSWQELVPVFVIPLAVQWWAAYYPGDEPGGGGYIAQRMLSAKNEKHAVGATFFFKCMNFALVPWPWILVALASLIVFPDLGALQARFPQMPQQVVQNDLAYAAMLTFLPAGLLGLVITSLAAAYMSTMSTQINWGSSVLVNDVYQRFIHPDATERQQVWAGRLCTVLLMVAACALALVLRSALQMFEILLQVGAGTGLLLLLRWFWWRVNAAAEITAMVTSFLVAVYFTFVSTAGLSASMEIVVGVAVTTVLWLVVAFATRPTDEAVLRRFYHKVQPGGPGWHKVLREARRDGVALTTGDHSDLPYALASAAVGAVSIYSVLFGTGFFIYGRTTLALVLGALAVLSAAALLALWPKLKFGSMAPPQKEAAQTDTRPR